jgi:hypothetical protein
MIHCIVNQDYMPLVEANSSPAPRIVMLLDETTPGVQFELEETSPASDR